MPADGAATVVLRAHRLSKTVGRTRLVDDVSFEVRRGDVFALVGGDGAGKSIVARMLVGLVVPTTGEAEVLGVPMGPGAFAVFERVSYGGAEPAFLGGLSARENLSRAMALRSIEDPTAISTALERVGLSDLADERASSLGDDQRRLLGVARAVVGRPEVLVLDEPTRGLGRAERRLVVSLLRELAVERQVTILAFGHVADGLTELASRVGVLNQGRLVGQFDRDELRERGRTHVEVVVSDTARAARVLEEGLGCTEFAVCQENLIRVYVDGARAGDINAALLAEGVSVTRLAINEGSLEDLLERLAGEGGRR
jgi:ABC-type multidrug transport system ATPase subunit